MPLLLISGKPCTGKTYAAERIKRHFIEKKRVTEEQVHIINTDYLELDPGKMLENETNYKMLRGSIKSTVTSLSDKHLIIVDSLLSIRSFRYELFSLAREYETTFCLLHCVVKDEELRFRVFEKSKKEKKIYGDRVYNKHSRRFDSPLEQNNFWDKPLLVFENTMSNEDPPLEELEMILFENKPLKSKQSTKIKKNLGGQKRFILDRTVKSVIEEIMDFQRTSMKGDILRLSWGESVPPITFKRKISLVWLQKRKHEFLKMVESSGIEADIKEEAEVARLFAKHILEYL